MKNLKEIMHQSAFSAPDLVELLSAEREEKLLLFDTADEIKRQYVGNKVYFRGLIEFSNICRKDCFYCGIRKSNDNIHRYSLSDEEILNSAKFAHDHHFGSIVLQAGEITTPTFVSRIEKLLRQIKKISNDQLGITLSLGEQKYDVYRRWFEAGAHRYLLRIETTNEELFRRMHPSDPRHGFKQKMDSLTFIKKIGYQTGTGVMIGLPFQTIGDLARDLLFFRDFDVDMVGMGPFLEHSQTPFYAYRNLLLPLQYRFNLSLKMIAALRLLMKNINIAAATALQAIEPDGREKALKAGANVIMPNITPGLYRNDYKLYENKPCIDEDPLQCTGCLDARIALTENEIGYGEWGDSLHFREKNQKT